MHRLRNDISAGPMLCGHAAQILREFGYDDSRIDALIGSKVVQASDEVVAVAAENAVA